jgi:hypothetical protein
MSDFGVAVPLPTVSHTVAARDAGSAGLPVRTPRLPLLAKTFRTTFRFITHPVWEGDSASLPDSNASRMPISNNRLDDTAEPTWRALATRHSGGIICREKQYSQSPLFVDREARNPTLRSGDDRRGLAYQHPRDAGDLCAVRNSAFVVVPARHKRLKTKPLDAKGMDGGRRNSCYSLRKPGIGLLAAGTLAWGAALGLLFSLPGKSSDLCLDEFNIARMWRSR